MVSRAFDLPFVVVEVAREARARACDVAQA
jgi:hypothetical protein